MAFNASVLYLFLFALYIVGQFWLSRQKNPYLGFILPVLTFLKSLGYCFAASAGSGHMMHNRNNYSRGFLWFVIYNIPTVILVLIYIGERKKLGLETPIQPKTIREDTVDVDTEEELRRMDEVEKMDIHKR